MQILIKLKILFYLYFYPPDCRRIKIEIKANYVPVLRKKLQVSRQTIMALKISG